MESKRTKLVKLLRDAGGESLTIGEITEESGIGERYVRSILRDLCSVPEPRRCIHEDSDGFSYASAE